MGTAAGKQRLAGVCPECLRGAVSCRLADLVSEIVRSISGEVKKQGANVKILADMSCCKDKRTTTFFVGSTWSSEEDGMQEAWCGPRRTRGASKSLEGTSRKS